MVKKIFSSVLLCLYFLDIIIATPLDDYVWAPDEYYKWEYMPEYDVIGNFGDCNYKAYFINMTSQKWLTDDIFTADSEAKSIWWHILVVIVPDQVQFLNNGTLYVTGNGMGMIKFNDSDDITGATYLACASKSITGVLFQVPNESYKFVDDPTQESRHEDGLIGYTWYHFLNDPTEPEWLVLFPMAKAAIKAMDTMTAFVSQNLPDLNCSLDYYLVAGGSKRGWTSWLAGAMDPVRVKAIVPIVLDALNFAQFIHMQYQKYGAFSFALSDFILLNVTTRVDEPNFSLMTSYMDPYFYFDRLTMPKMVVNGAMDELQHPDDTHNWWEDLPEPKKFLLVPNSDHGMAPGIFEALPAISAFAVSKYHNHDVPEFSWTRDDVGGVLTAVVENDAKIHSVTAWWAYSCGVNSWDNNKNRRDFRLVNMDNQFGGRCFCGNAVGKTNNSGCANIAALWNSQPIQPLIASGKRTYTVSHADFFPPNKDTWIAFLIDFKFENPYKYMNLTGYNRELKERFMKKGQKIGIPEDLGNYLEFTTEVSIWPNTYPYPPCTGVGCGVRMV